MPRELLEDVLRQELDEHADGEVGLGDLVALVRDICEVEVQLLDVGQADVARADEGGEACVGCGADFEGDFAVEVADGEFVELFAGEADVLEVGGTDDLRFVLAACVTVGSKFVTHEADDE